MKNIIKINVERKEIIHKDYRWLGVENENNIDTLNIELNEELITDKATPYLEIEFPDMTKKLIEMDKISPSEAEIKIKNSLLKQEGCLILQFVLVSGNNTIFKSEVFKLRVKEAINATESIEDEYPTILDEINTLKNMIKELSGVDVSKLNKKIEELEKKIENISNYDDSEIRKEIDNLKKLIEGIELKKGEDGATFTPNVSEDGFLSWTNNKELVNPEPVNIKGEPFTYSDFTSEQLESLRGPQGPQGEPGKYSEQDYCSAQTTTYEQFTERKYYTNLEKRISIGEYYFDEEKQGIVIPPGTSILEIGGVGAGGNYARVGVELRNYDTDEYIYDNSTLMQTSGNKYWRLPLPIDTIPTDPNKKYYLKLNIAPYNTEMFYLNDGFTPYSTYIYAKKIK